MKGKQISLLEEFDRYQLEHERRETDAVKQKLDDTYGRMDIQKLRDRGYPDGSVVIIGQHLFRNNHYTLHFYRTVLGHHRSVNDPYTWHFVESPNEEWPDRAPWADTVGHEGEARDIGLSSDFIYWATGEVVEPIIPWWMKNGF